MTSKFFVSAVSLSLGLLPAVVHAQQQVPPPVVSGSATVAVPPVAVGATVSTANPWTPPPAYAQPTQYPPGTYPPGTYPPGTYAPGAYPPGTYPPGTYAPPQQQYVLAQPSDERIPYEGGPIPPGYHYGTRPRVGLVIAGAVTFGVTWLITAYVGLLAGGITTGYHSSDCSTCNWLAVPVIGPIGAGAAAGDLNGAGWTILVFDSLAQAAGVAMFVIGFVNPSQYVQRNLSGHAAPAHPRWALLPGTAAGGHGATFTLSF